MATDKQGAPPIQITREQGLLYSGVGPAGRLGSALTARHDPIGESSEGHRDRLFLQVLLSLALNTLALLAVFYFLLPLSESGRLRGGLLLWSVLGITLAITAIFLVFGRRILCVNLLLMMLGSALLGSSFMLGGMMSPTMIFMLAIPVLAGTLMNSRWTFFWMAMTIGAWLLVMVLEFNGVEMTRVTRLANVGIVQLIALLGTVLVVMAVLGSYVSASNRLRAALELKNARLGYLASYDSLTSIPNRRTFFEQAQRCLQRARRSNYCFAMLVIDLNDFKQVNDQLGHKVGDAVLVHFAQRLSRGFRETDFIGRLGGDEFGVLLEPVDSAASVPKLLERFRDSGSGALEVGGVQVAYNYSAGIAVYPDGGDTILGLYESADAAMYHSKKALGLAVSGPGVG